MRCLPQRGDGLVVNAEAAVSTKTQLYRFGIVRLCSTCVGEQAAATQMGRGKDSVLLQFDNA